MKYMFGFKKKINKPEAQKISARIIVIPESFYGAKDPVVHYKQAKEIGVNVSPEKKWHPRFAWRERLSFEFLRKNWIKYAGMGFLFLVAIGLISWYYLNQAGFFAPAVVAPSTEKISASSESIAEEANTNQTTSTALSEDNIATTTPEIIVPTTTPALQERTLEFPQIFLTNSADVDNDSLTDMEEEIFGVDSGAWDTDGDGYYDGQEVFNLYNPKGIAPMKIVDSGLVQEYVNPNWQYRVYFPVSWQVGTVDTEANQALFSALTGDFVEIDVFTKEENETFTDWFARKAVGQKYSDLQVFTNRFKEDGYKRADDLVAYFTADKRVYVLSYHPGATGFIPYRHVMQMMAQSFRPNKTSVDIPPQTVLPPPPAFDTSTASSPSAPAEISTPTTAPEFVIGQ